METTWIPPCYDKTGLITYKRHIDSPLLGQIMWMPINAKDFVLG